MPSFSFEAMDASGSKVNDRIDAANQANAHQQLRERGYFVTRLREVRGGPLESLADVQRLEVVPQVDPTPLAVEPSREGASVVHGSAASSDPAQHLCESGWIIEPTDTGGVRMRTRPLLRWVMIGCLFALLLFLTLFMAPLTYPIVRKWREGPTKGFFGAEWALFELAYVGVCGLIVGGIVLQILWLLFVHEEWEASRNSLEIRRRFLGCTWDRHYQDAELILDSYYEKNRAEPRWQLVVKSDGQKHFLVKAGALSSLGGAVFYPQFAEVTAISTLLAKYTGWSTISAKVETTQEARSVAPLQELPAELTKRGFRSDFDEQLRLIIRRPKRPQVVAGLILVGVGGGALWLLSGGVASYVQHTSTVQETFWDHLVFWLIATPMLMFFMGIALVGVVCICGRQWWIMGRNLLIVRSRVFGWTTDRHYVDGAMTVMRVVRTYNNARINDGLRYRWELKIQNQAGKVLTTLHSDIDDDVPRLLGALLSDHTGWPLRDG